MKRLSTKRIVVHCSATKTSQEVGAAEIDQWHRARGFSSIGYHAVIRRDGRIEWGRHFDLIGAHALGHNNDSLGFCLEGGLRINGIPGERFEDTFTPWQDYSLRKLIELSRIAYSGIEDVCGHRDLSPDKDGDGVVERHEWLKQCPTFDVREWVKGGSR